MAMGEEALTRLVFGKPGEAVEIFMGLLSVILPFCELEVTSLTIRAALEAAICGISIGCCPNIGFGAAFELSTEPVLGISPGAVSTIFLENGLATPSPVRASGLITLSGEAFCKPGGIENSRLFGKLAGFSEVSTVGVESALKSILEGS